MASIILTTKPPETVLLENASHGVVLVVSKLNTPDTTKNSAIGTGFFIDDNKILTNNHVIDNAEKIIIHAKENAKDYIATVVAKDAFADIAILKLDDPDSYKKENKVTILKLADMGTVKTGMSVWAIGNPWSLTWSVSKGIVSAESRRIGDMRFYVQTDAHVYNGNSGGPLLNSNNEVIGINDIMLAQNGGSYGFAIPSNMIKKAVNDLTKYNETYWARLGLGINPGSDKDRIKISSVVPGSAAEKAGIKANDYVISIATKYTNNMPVDLHNYDKFQDLITLVDKDETVTVVVERDGKQIIFKDIVPTMMTGSAITADMKARAEAEKKEEEEEQKKLIPQFKVIPVPTPPATK